MKEQTKLYDERDRQLLIQQELITCKHFTGIQNETCDAGIVYETVYDYPEEAKIDPNASNLQIPCLSGKYCRTVCEKREFPTLEEATADIEKQERQLEQFITAIVNSECPTHKIKVTKQQIGRCVYAIECGCRLYQGKI